MGILYKSADGKVITKDRNAFCILEGALEAGPLQTRSEITSLCVVGLLSHLDRLGQLESPLQADVSAPSSPHDA